MTNKNLAIQLASLEREDDIIDLLSNLGYWNNYAFWRPFGDNDNNFSTIGNQQSKPDAALVEKFINSVDAILMKECMIRKIDMTSSHAPQSMAEALKTFFNIREGQLSYLDSNSRNQMSENIILAATGNTIHMNLTIADRGEGQTPNRLPETILSVSKNNKLRVPFVQGKFNMGGTGVLPFCGKNRLQLVISRRCPDIPNFDNDDSFDNWSVTIVRREPAREGRRSSMFTYLTDKNGDILRFSADSLPIIPKAHGDGYEDMTYGTYFKLYDYALKGYKSNVLFDFNYRMSMLMPELAHPIRIRECRSSYSGHSFETTLSGLRTRLYDDRGNNIEEGFPTSDVFNIDGQKIRCSIYVFKKGKADNFRKKEGILYIVNGQTHATVSESFFNRVNLSYLADSILILLDCSDIDELHREDMFMNSRDRLRDGAFVTEITNQLKEVLRDHAGLKKLQNERRAQAVHEYLNDDKPLKNVLQDILSKSPVLSKVLLAGTKLTNPFNTSSDGGSSANFEGKKHPTFFNVKGKLTNGQLIKTVPINSSFRLQFETDAENEYFSRPDERGSLELYLDNVQHPELVQRFNLRDGIATLKLGLPEDGAVGDRHNYKVVIVDDYIYSSLENTISVEIIEAVPPKGNSEHNKDNDKDGKPLPPGDQDPGKRNEPAGIGMPSIKEILKKDWDSFDMNKDSALIAMMTEEGSDYYINMDNQYLLVELKGIKDQNKLALTRARYKYSMALLGMSIESYYKKNQEESENDDVAQSIRKMTSIISPVLIPMLDSMAELNTDDI